MPKSRYYRRCGRKGDILLLHSLSEFPVEEKIECPLFRLIRFFRTWPAATAGQNRQEEKRRGGSRCGNGETLPRPGSRCIGPVGPSGSKITRTRNQKRPGTSGGGRKPEGEALHRIGSVGIRRGAVGPRVRPLSRLRRTSQGDATWLGCWTGGGHGVASTPLNRLFSDSSGFGVLRCLLGPSPPSASNLHVHRGETQFTCRFSIFSAKSARRYSSLRSFSCVLNSIR